jgi:murein DD-endopeptidase MepM/ murein hydrolase activator NlpD
MGNKIKIYESEIKRAVRRKLMERFVDEAEQMTVYDQDEFNKSFDKLKGPYGVRGEDGKIRSVTVNEEDESEINNKNMYILDGSFTIIKVDKESRPFGNWQTDNSTYFKVNAGTQLNSITKGTVIKIGGSDSTEGKFYGNSITVGGEEGYPNTFYAHISDIEVSVGQKVGLGTPLAKVSDWDDNPNLTHTTVSLNNGEKINSLINTNTGKIIS